MKKWLLSLLCVCWATITPANTHYAQQALQAYKTHNIAALNTFVNKMAGEPLEPYVRYWLFASDWSNVSDATLAQFLEQYKDTPLADRARIEWSEYQIQQHRNPNEILYILNTLQRPDNEAMCLRWQLREKQNDRAVFSEAQRWFFRTKLPNECHQFFVTLMPKMSDQERPLYVRSLWYEKKTALVQQILETQQYAITLSALTQIANNPEPFLSTLTLTTANSELGVLGVMRLARTHPERAVEYLRYLPFSAEQRHYLWGQAALSAAKEHLPTALLWFEAADSSTLTEEQWEWRIRAALRVQDWQQVKNITQAMPKEWAQEPPWIYWRARALKALGHPYDAEQLFKTLVQKPTFYGILAAEEVNQPFTLLPTTSPTNSGNTDNTAPPMGILRAFALFQLNLRTLAINEWQWALKDMNDAQFIATAMLAQRHGLYDRMIDAAMRTQTQHDFSLRYPLLFREALRNNAKRFDIDETYAYGIIHQESRFSPEIRSGVGAAGLMQLMPTTAKWMANKLGIPYHPIQITHPTTNVTLGTGYLRKLFDHLTHPAVVAAAYNAGPSRAQRWKDEAKAMDGAIYAETIPFTETRQYVKKVLTNTMMYRHQIGQPITLHSLLAQVPARSPTEDAKISILP